MDIKSFIKSKQFKNGLLTLLEILIVAAILFSALMFVYNKVNREAKTGTIHSADNSSADDEKNKNQNAEDYYLEVNQSKNTLIVYQYTDSKHQEKNAVKAFSCSIGKSLKKGKYKTQSDYEWVKNNGAWHQYNTKLKEGIRIQSVGFKTQYPYMLERREYQNIGKKISGSSICLYSGDAAWISKNCKTSTEVRVVKGKKTDELPMKPEEPIRLKKYCGWDPTDPSAQNPYLKVKPGKLVSGNKTVVVEKGEKISYLANLLAFDESGKNILGRLKYKKFSETELGKHTVTYTYRDQAGHNFEIKQEFQVTDTICPKVSCSKSMFTLEVASRIAKDINTKENVTKIENMVRPYVSCSETGCTITIHTVVKEELTLKTFPVIITAKDESGNIGSCQVMVELKINEDAQKVKGVLSDKEKESLLKRNKEIAKEREETTKRQKKKTSEKNKEPSTGETANDEETTLQSE